MFVDKLSDTRTFSLRIAPVTFLMYEFYLLFHNNEINAITSDSKMRGQNR